MAATLIRKAAPDVDDAIIDYLDGYLKENDFDDENEDAIDDFVKPLLIDAGGKEDRITALCAELTKLFDTHRAAAEKNASATRKLEQAITIGSQSGVSATARLGASGVELDHLSGKRVQSQVDQDKLRKAEAKIAAKMAKRQQKTNQRVEYEASKLINEQKALQEEYKLYNPILDYTSTKGKIKDIKIENFDISFAGRRILTDANLTVAFGRRYGVVGKNGIGKSTLLRAIARREVSVPHHISVLYVEQEVCIFCVAMQWKSYNPYIRLLAMIPQPLKWCCEQMSGVSTCWKKNVICLAVSPNWMHNSMKRRSYPRMKRTRSIAKRIV